MNTKLIVKAFFGAAFALTGARLSAETRVVDKLHGPYFSVQEAVDAASDGDTVFIKNGVHDVGGSLDGFTTSMSNRVYITKSLTLVGESKEGAIIKGAHATEGVDDMGLGCGANAVRCLGINADNVVVSNLTLTGGATHNTSSGNDQPENNGGGVYAVNGKKGIVIVDCIISNNVARRAGAVRYNNDGAVNHGNCLLVRTWVHGNKSLNRDPAVRGCLAAFCLFTRHYSSGSITYAATFVNCTFADGFGRNHSETAAVVGYNCFFADKWFRDDGKAQWFNCAFNKSDATTTSTTNEACVFNPGYDLFMAPPLVDYRLHNGATAVIGKGDATFLDQIPEAYRNLDFYGHAVDATSVSLGCAQEVVTPTGGTITFVGQPGMSVAPEMGIGGGTGASLDCGQYFFNGVALDSPIRYGYIRTMEGCAAITVTHDPTHATSVSRQMGIHSFAASGADTARYYANADGAFVFVAPTVGKTLTLTPNFNNAIVYVDRASTASEPDGSEAAPYASLSAALSSLASATYATVHVKPGVYDNGTMTQTRAFGASDNATYALPARAVVPANVSVFGAGADKTFIVGAEDPDAATENKGCGPNAVRCVALAKGSRLMGFTLTGGRTNAGVLNAAGKYPNVDDDEGAGVLAEYAQGEAMAIVSDCIISNCVARRGGGGYNGLYNRVRFFDNSIIQNGNGSAARGNDGKSCILANCLIDRNEGWATVYYSALINCTFGEDNTQNRNKNNAQVIADASSVTNCLILGTKNATAKTAFYACAFSSATETLLKKNSSAGVDASCLVSDDLSVDDSFAPVIGANAAVDAAGTAFYDAAKWGDKDVYGNPRVMNGNKMDVGAVEADWRPLYTKKIGKRFVVTAVDPAVELVDDGVAIPAGASLAATVGRAGRADDAYFLKATVADGATCAVTRDGVAAESLTAGENVVRYVTGETGLSDFVFTADALGSTVLSSLKADTGMLLILR